MSSRPPDRFDDPKPPRGEEAVRREAAARELEERIEEETGANVRRGEDFRVRRTEEGFRGVPTDSFRESMERETPKQRKERVKRETRERKRRDSPKKIAAQDLDQRTEVEIDPSDIVKAEDGDFRLSKEAAAEEFSEQAGELVFPNDLEVTDEGGFELTESAERRVATLSTSEELGVGIAPSDLERTGEGFQVKKEAGADLIQRQTGIDLDATDIERTAANREGPTTGPGDSMSREIVTDGHHIPAPVKPCDYWVLWDFKLKQPRAPWETGHCFPSEWKQEGHVNPRTNFDQAMAATDLGPEKLDELYGFPEDPPERVGPTLLLPHSGDETPGPEPAEPPLLFIDYDDVIMGGEAPAEVWDMAAEIGGPLFVSRSFYDPDKESAGLHQLARGELPGSLTTVPATDFEERGHVEVYKQSRMTGFTWQHVRGSPTDDIPTATDAIAELVDRLGSENTKRRASNDPEAKTNSTPIEDLTPPDELADIDSTDDVHDVFSAIRQIKVGDIRLRSTLEEEGARRSYDPSWTNSESGTRLGYDTIDGEETWIYRAANQPVDALQVVAAEEGILTDVTDYPEGSEFWKAVEALPSRGATIPYYEGDDGTHPDYLRLFEEPEDEEDARRKAIRAMRASNRS